MCRDRFSRDLLLLRSPARRSAKLGHPADEALHIDSYLAGCRMGLLLATGAV